MGNYVVVYDPAKEMGAIIDTDNRVGFGPAMIGPDAEVTLSAFLDALDFEPDGVPSDVLRSWFEQWAPAFLAAVQEARAASQTGAMEPDGGDGLADAALAAHEAAAAGAEPPGVQPADADMDADTGATAAVASPAGTATETPDGNGDTPPPYSGTCFACNGTGTITLVPDEPPAMCSACRGTGKLPAPVA